MSANRVWQYGAWYEFLENPGVIGKAGLLDPVAMASYKKTLSVSLGHQLIVNANRFFGFETGLTVLYVFIAALFSVALYLFAFRVSSSRIIAFFITFLVINTDVLAMGHVGACGHLGQTAGRDYLALAFFLLAIFFLMKDRAYLYWLFLMIGFLSHLSDGLMAFAVLLPYTLIYTGDRRFKIFHVSSFCLITLALYAYQSIGAPLVDLTPDPLWFKWSYLFAGGHIFWDHSIHYLAPTYAFFSIVVAGLSLPLTSRNGRLVITVTAGFGFLAIVATFFLYVIPLQIVYRLTPLRSTFLLSAIILVLLLDYLFKAIAGGRLSRTAVGALGIFALLTSTFAGIFLASAAACVLAAIDTIGRKRAIALILLASVCVLFLLYLPERYVDTWSLKQISLLLILIIAFIFVKISPIGPVPKGIGVVSIGIICMVCVASTPSRYVQRPGGPVIERLKEYYEVSDIITTRTELTRPVISAPFWDLPALEITARRGSVLQWPKAPLAFVVPSLLPGMNEALTLLGLDVTSFQGNWLDLQKDAASIWEKGTTRDRFLHVGKRYNSSYLLTYADHQLDLPIIFHGKYFNLYSLAE